MMARGSEAMASDAIQAQLDAGLVELNISLSQGQKDKLIEYLALLLKWNTAFNLSGVKDANEMLSRHILDSLTLLPFMEGSQILDVGTGPGLPGVPLAICFPEKRFDLLDSNGKKSRFVFQAKVQLGLDNVTAQNERVENYKPDAAIDVIVSRAFSSLRDFVAMTKHLVQPGRTRLVAMKGLYPEEELALLPEGFVMNKASKVAVPGYTGERHIIELRTKAAE
jgi:16S rRNA (guanine527-N7)-methyltransferase